MMDTEDPGLRARLEALAAAVPVEPEAETEVVTARVRVLPGRGDRGAGRSGRHRFGLGLATAATLVVAVVAVVAMVGSGWIARLPSGPAGPGVPGVPLDTGGPVVATTRDGPFELSIRASKGVYAEGEAIDIAGSLTYLGPEASISIGHSQGARSGGERGGPMGFSIDEPVLGNLRLGGAWADSCEGTTLERGRPIEAAFEKGGGWSGDDPQASAYLAYMLDPVLRLPPGVWHVRVVTDFSVGECSANGLEMMAALEIVVRAADGSVPTGVAPAATRDPRDEPTGADVQDGPLRLTVSSPHARVRAGEPIEVIAELGYWRDDAGIQLYGSSRAGPVGFAIHQLDGPVVLGSQGMTECADLGILPADSPRTIPFTKAGLHEYIEGADPGSDDWHGWMTEPELRLPVGRWEIHAFTMFATSPGCRALGATLDASIVIAVVP